MEIIGRGPSIVILSSGFMVIGQRLELGVSVLRVCAEELDLLPLFIGLGGLGAFLQEIERPALLFCSKMHNEEKEIGMKKLTRYIGH